MFEQEERNFLTHREYMAGPKKGQMFKVEVLTSVMFDVEFNNELSHSRFYIF